MQEPFLFDQIRSRPTGPIDLPEPVRVLDLPTPALVLDRSLFSSNLAKMAAHVAAHGKGFRPHAKTHKCPEIAKAQVASGAVGVCVAKVSEAVAQTGAGVDNILITSPITTPGKVAILDRLASEGHQLMIVVDSLVGLNQLQSGIASENRLDILIDLDVNMGRTGVREDATVLELINKINDDERLGFRGFQFYAGHVMHIEGFADRREASLSLWSQVSERIENVRAEGINFDIVTGCGTGTFNIDIEVDSITDLQVGSFIFMDEEYRRIGGEHNDRFLDFDVSLTIATTTISQPMNGAMTVDAGFKSMASDTVPAAVDELANTKFRFAGDEHGVLLSKESMQSLKLGDVVELVTPHCDPTVNLHDFYWVKENDGLIHSCWPITGRGCTW
ncbi:MAG: DSD1 family PLP-dependent enzyme [Pseudomonadales bacterium]|nr:DSD1 family PLP-dependent enzyme [Pseudomonadales bacterium]